MHREELIRDPPATPGTIALVAAVLPLVFLAQGWLYDMAGLPHISNRELLYLLVVAIAVSCGALFPSPVWVRVGPAGIGLRNWLRAEHYAWNDVAGIEVGNPDEARYCYLVLKAATGQQPRTILLPRLRSVPPLALAANLREKQRHFIEARSSGSPGASKP